MTQLLPAGLSETACTELKYGTTPICNITSNFIQAVGEMGQLADSFKLALKCALQSLGRCQHVLYEVQIQIRSELKVKSQLQWL